MKTRYLKMLFVFMVIVTTLTGCIEKNESGVNTSDLYDSKNYTIEICSFFFQDEKEIYTYSVNKFLYENIENITVDFNHVKSYERGEVYTAYFIYDDSPYRYYYGGDRYNMGPFFVTKDEIYFYPWRDDIPTEDEFLENGVLVCSQKDGEYDIKDNEKLHGYKTKIQNVDNECKCSIFCPAQGSTFYWRFTWIKGEGLSYFCSGYGAEGEPVEVKLVN